MQSKQQPVLFLTLPNVSLFMNKCRDAMGLALGSCFVSGAVESAGFEVDHFDFNLALNQKRNLPRTPHATIDILTQPSQFLDFYHGRRTDALIDSWLDALIAMIPSRDYFAVCLSLDRRDYYALCNKASFSFALLVARRLKQRFSIPIVLGGNRAIKAAGPSFTNAILDGLPQSPIDKISKAAVISSIGKFLNALKEGMDINSEEANEIFHRWDKFSEAAGMVPTYLIKNYEDLLVRPQDYLPEMLLKKYPKLQDIEPFFVAPYKFSEGCPFTCAFCADGLSMKYRQNKASQIVDVLAHLYSKGVKHYSFYNNNINLNNHFLEELHQGFVNNNMKIQFSDSANLQNASHEMFKRLADMGCVRLWYGTETVSERLLKIIKKDLNQEKIERGLKAADDNGIWNCCNFIYNFPHETDEEFARLVNFITSSEVLNTYEANEFLLLAETDYSKHPEQFGIEIQYASDNGMISAYDEIGGMKWADKQALGVTKKKAMNRVKRPIFKFLAQNDYVLFGLRSIGLTKIETKAIFTEYDQYLAENDLYLNYIEDHYQSIPNHLYRKRPPGSIMGQDVLMNNGDVETQLELITSLEQKF